LPQLREENGNKGDETKMSLSEGFLFPHFPLKSVNFFGFAWENMCMVF